VAVVGFWMFSHSGHPICRAGLFSSAPSVAVASLAIASFVNGADGTVASARGMLVGSAGMLVYGVVSLYLIQRLHALIGSILAWLAWLVVEGGLYLVLGR